MKPSFLDDSSVRIRCMQHEFWKCLKPKFNPIISDRDSEILKEYFSGRDRFQRIDL